MSLKEAVVMRSRPEPNGGEVLADSGKWPIKIVIPGKPGTYQKHVGQWRSRDGRSGIRAYDDKSYAAWRHYARGRAAEVCGTRAIECGPVRVWIAAFVMPPKATSKKALAAALAWETRPTVKPDVDNIAKAVFDSCLTGIVIRDDNQVVELIVTKYFSDQPRVEVRIDV